MVDSSVDGAVCLQHTVGMGYRVHTRECLARVAAESTSVAEVCRKLGVSDFGNMNTHIKRRLLADGISMSHFHGKGSNRGPQHVGGPDKLLPSEVFVRGRLGQNKEKVRVLRRAMLEYGLPNCCSLCGQKDTWNGQPLVLQVDHINGDSIDNQIENIRFLCPNCHSQTPTFAGNKRRAVKG